MPHFADRLNDAVRAKGNAVLVGMDPRWASLPPEFREGRDDSPEGHAEAYLWFAHELLQLVAPRVPAVKFQSAFYEALGSRGLAALESSMRHASRLGLIVIFDGKRNDIGTTAEAYAEAYLGGKSWSADAITVNPYLGTDGIEPFVKVAERTGKGLYVLVRTSNPSARDFQDLKVDGRPLYAHVAEKLATWADRCRNSDGESAVGAVVGATYPSELAELRHVLPGVPFLVPGYGAQGGSAADVASAFDARGLGVVVNSSRGILFAHEKPSYRERFGDDWRAAVNQAVTDMIEDLAGSTSCGRLASERG